MGGSKIERIRHLFKECLKDCTKKEIFLLIFADYEENFGLLSHAMDIYDRATREVPNQMHIWNIYLSKAMNYYGVVRCR
jgi:pre-mRNA-splicing factor SYF1